MAPEGARFKNGSRVTEDFDVSGTVSNRDADGGPGKPVSAGGLGYSCIAEVRMVETIECGAPVTSFSIATTERFTDREGQKKEDTQWHNVVLWGKTADNFNTSEFLAKLIVSGILGSIALATTLQRNVEPSLRFTSCSTA